MRLFYVAFVYFFLHSVFVKAQAICGVKDTDLSSTTIKAMQMAPKWAKMRKNKENDFFVCKLGVEIDAHTYHRFNGDSLLILAELTNTIEKVSGIFERDINIRIVLSHLSLLKDTTTDHYNQQTALFRLLLLANRWPRTRLDNSDLDAVMHLSLFQYSDARGIAFQPGNYNVSPWGDIQTIVHELGHNLGSPHSQNCEWPGGPLEHCTSSEYGCKDDELLHQEELGTVMGYCKSSLKFHPLSVAVIEMEAGNRLTKVSQAPGKYIHSEGTYATDISHLIFKPDFQAEKYRYEFSENPGFNSILATKETQSNYISIGELVSGKKYYLRIKSINRFGSSDWSDAKEVSIASNSLRPPFLGKAYSNSANTALLDWDDAMVKIPISGSGYPDYYEIEMYDYKDAGLEFLLVKAQITGDSKEYSFVPIQNQVYTNFIIRVRSKKGENYGAWSIPQIQEFDFSGGYFDTFFKDKNNMPLSFPLASNENIDENTTYFIKEKGDKNFMPIENGSFSKDPVTYTPLSIILQGLKPNTEYIVQKQLSSEPTLNYQDFESRKTIKSNFNFKTGTFQNTTNYSFESKHNDPHSGLNESLPLFYNNQEIVYHERGTTVKNLVGKNSTEYNFLNTGGDIGNFTKAHNLDKENGLYVQLSGMNKWTDFQSMTYAICKYDINNNLKLIEKKEISLPSNEFPRWVSFSGKIVMGFQDLYVVKNDNETERVYNEVYPFKIKESQNYIWILGNNKAGFWGLYKIRKDDYTLTFWGNCFDFDIDSNEDVVALSDGRLYLDSNSQRINPYQQTSIAADDWGYVYLVSEHDNRLAFSKYKDKQLIKEVVLPPTSIFHRDNLIVTSEGSLQLNRRNNVSFKVNMCDPVLPPTSLEKSISQKNIILTAHGCENTLWRWKSSSGILKEVFQTGNKFSNAENETVYTVNCFKEGCRSQEKVISLVSQPEILDFRLEKDTVCLGEVYSLYLETNKGFSEENEFNLLFYAKDKQDLLKTVALESFGEQYRFTGSLPAGNYTVKVSSSNPESVSKKELSLVIRELPAINITQKYVIGSVELSVTELPGVRYTWFEEGRPMTGETGHKITTNKPLIYKATADDGVCQSDAAEHLVELALANENGSALIVYENPSISGIFYASLNMPSSKIADMTVTDMMGRVLVKTKVKTNEKVEINLKDFQPGRYVLKIGGLSRSLIKL